MNDSAFVCVSGWMFVCLDGLNDASCTDFLQKVEYFLAERKYGREYPRSLPDDCSRVGLIPERIRLTYLLALVFQLLANLRLIVCLLLPIGFIGFVLLRPTKALFGHNCWEFILLLGFFCFCLGGFRLNCLSKLQDWMEKTRRLKVKIKLDLRCLTSFLPVFN